MKTEHAIRDWAIKMCEGSKPFFYKQNEKEHKIVKRFIKIRKTIWGVPSDVPARLREAERDPMPNRASSATLNAPSTAAEFGRDPDMLHHVPMAA